MLSFTSMPVDDANAKGPLKVWNDELLNHLLTFSNLLTITKEEETICPQKNNKTTVQVNVYFYQNKALP